jgi:hypothetical protein
MKGFIAIGAVLFASGCAFSPVNAPAPEKYTPLESKVEIKNLDKTQTLEVVKSALTSFGYEVVSVIPELGEVKTKNLQVQIPERCDCGTWNGNVVSGSAQSRMEVIVSNTQPTGTKAVIKHYCATEFYGRNIYGMITTQQPIVCASRGTIEKDVLDKIDRIAGARAQK